MAQPATDKRLFDNDSERDALFSMLEKYDHQCLTSISLAIVRDRAQAALSKFVKRYRNNGGKAIFASEYRPGLWQRKEHAKLTISPAFSLSDIALRTIREYW